MALPGRKLFVAFEKRAAGANVLPEKETEIDCL